MSVFSACILATAYIYLWICIWKTFFKSFYRFGFAYVCFCLLISALCMMGTVGFSMPFGLTRPIAYAGGTMMIFAFYCDVLFFSKDIFALMGKRFHWRFVPLLPHGKIGALFIAVAVLVTGYGAFNAKDTVTTHYDIELDGYGHHQSYTIVMATDTHFGALYDENDLRLLVDQINAMQPDLVLFAGDMVDRSSLAMKDADAYRVEFNRLSAPLGVYACMGNHENFYGGDAMRAFLADTPVVLLEDEAVVIDGSFVLIGRQDTDIEGRATMEVLTSGLNTSLPIVVMDHQPVSLGEEQQADASLVLCGHTHGGQVFPMTLVSALSYEVPYGFAQKENLNVVVSSGYGAWGTPLRIGTKRELVVITLHFYPH